MKNEALFSPDPQIRWEASRDYAWQQGEALAQEIAERYAAWPKYWWGVGNAWLVFVGPSPGNSGGYQIDWDRERLPTIGQPHEHYRTQWDSRGFWDRMRGWPINGYRQAGLFGDDSEAALSSVLLANVLDVSAGDAGQVTHLLPAAMPRVLDNLALVKPRLIVPMHKQVSELLISEFRRCGAVIINGPEITPVPAKSQRFSHYKPRSWQLTVAWGPLLIAEAPQHPSKRNFYDPAEFDRYLADKIKICLNSGPKH